MRLFFHTDKRPKQMARALKQALEANGVSMKLTSAQNQIARMYGYRSYSDLKGCLGQPTPSTMTSLTSDDYHPAAVSRLAADNAWPVEFAEGICERLKHIVDMCLMRATFASTGHGAENSYCTGDSKRSSSPERPVVVERIKRRSSLKGRPGPKARIFNLAIGKEERGHG